MQDSSIIEQDPAPSRQGGPSELRVGVGGIGGGSGGGGGIPSFERDPVTYLTLLVTSPRSSSSLHKLAGSVAATVTAKGRSSAFSSANGAASGKGGGGGGGGSPYGLSSDVAYLYLQAAARHLPAAVDAASAAPSSEPLLSSSSGMALFNPFEAFSRATARPSSHDPETDVPGGGADEGDGDAKLPSWGMSYTKGGRSDSTHAILEAIGYAAACCQPRSLVAQSGILPVLADMLPVPLYDLLGRQLLQQARGRAVALVPLTAAQVEFLQACIYAKEYRYGEDLVAGHWPRPTNSAVPLKLVLRYYYLRGTLHVGTGNWAAARRCYWTCLSVPADDMVSSIAVAAWKKLVLVQCRMMLLEARNHRASSSHPLTLPKAVPVCFSRFLNDALSRTAGAASSSSSSSSQMALDAAYSAAQEAGREEYPEMMHMVEAGSDNEGGPTDPARRAEAAAQFGVRAYGDLAGAYATLDQAQFQAKMAEHEALFQRDGNLGLVRQCFEQLLRRQVVFWSRVYSAISLTDLASAVKVTVEKLGEILVGLSNEVAWSIQVRDGIVHFPPVPKSSSATPLPSHDELIQLARLAQELDASVEASPKYLALSKRLGPSLRADARPSAGPLGIEEMHVDPSS